MDDIEEAEFEPIELGETEYVEDKEVVEDEAVSIDNVKEELINVKEVAMKGKGGKLISKLDHPVTVSYDGAGLILAPKAILENVKKEKLGTLPKGVIYVDSQD